MNGGSGLVEELIGGDPEVDHPSHYGGKDNAYETIKVIECWGKDINQGGSALSYGLCNAVKYISRCNLKSDKVQDLKKAMWYIQREIDSLC
jgi:hypothetical protein